MSKQTTAKKLRKGNKFDIGAGVLTAKNVGWIRNKVTKDVEFVIVDAHSKMSGSMTLRFAADRPVTIHS